MHEEEEEEERRKMIGENIRRRMNADVCCVFLQKEFVRLIQSSGILVVLSQAWIEELYRQVLEHNLLGEAGYWGSPEDHALPLITVLTGTRAFTSTSVVFFHLEDD